jgi:hypothetical protein
MANFVDGFGNKSRGYPLINLDQVAVLRPRKHDGWQSFECFDAENRCLGSISSDTLDELTNRQRLVIPNTAGIVLLSFQEDDTHESGIEMDRYAVLAWRVEGTWPTPIILEEIHEGDIYCYEQRIGDHLSYIFPSYPTLTTIEEARAKARTLLTQRQERAARQSSKSNSAGEVT